MVFDSIWTQVGPRFCPRVPAEIEKSELQLVGPADGIAEILIQVARGVRKNGPD
jgi:hypothetical protein